MDSTVQAAENCSGLISFIVDSIARSAHFFASGEAVSDRIKMAGTCTRSTYVCCVCFSALTKQMRRMSKENERSRVDC